MSGFFGKAGLPGRRNAAIPPRSPARALLAPNSRRPVTHVPGVAPALAHPHCAGGPSGTGYSRLHRKRSASALARPGSPVDALAEVEAPTPVAAEPVAEAAVPEAAVPEAAVPEAAVPKAAVPEAAVPEAAVPDAGAPEAAAPEEGNAQEQEEGPQQGEAASAARRREELLREEQRAAERQRAETAAAEAAREIAAAAFSAAAAAPTAAEPAGQAQPEPVLAKPASAAAEADAAPAKPAAAKPFSYAAAAAKPAPAAEAVAEPPKPAKPAPAASAKPAPAPKSEAVPVAASAAAPQSDAVAAAKPADAPASGRERYRELLFRLGTFLPTVKDAAAACADATDHASFEATWELLKVTGHRFRWDRERAFQALLHQAARALVSQPAPQNAPLLLLPPRLGPPGGAHLAGGRCARRLGPGRAPRAARPRGHSAHHHAGRAEALGGGERPRAGGQQGERGAARRFVVGSPLGLCGGLL